MKPYASNAFVGYPSAHTRHTHKLARCLRFRIKEFHCMCQINNYKFGKHQFLCPLMHCVRIAYLCIETLLFALVSVWVSLRVVCVQWRCHWFVSGTTKQSVLAPPATSRDAMKRVAESQSWFFLFSTFISYFCFFFCFHVLNLVDFRTAHIIGRLHTFKGTFRCSSIANNNN